jgi:O-antigen/teichoic acid export membrane protein
VIAVSDRYIIALMLGTAEAGIYGAAYDFSHRSLWVFMMAAFLASGPLIFRSFEHGDAAACREHLQRLARLHIVVALPAAMMLAAAAPLVARIVFGPEFRADAALLMPWIVAATLVAGLQAFYASLFFMLPKRTGTNALISLGGSLVNVPLTILLVHQLGIVGAAIATLATYLLVLTGTCLVGRRFVRLPWPVADTVKSLGACAAGAPLFLLAGQQSGILRGLALAALGGLVLMALMVLLDTAALRRWVVATHAEGWRASVERTLAR